VHVLASRSNARCSPGNKSCKTDLTLIENELALFKPLTYAGARVSERGSLSIQKFCCHLSL
jgi:hypothetical protein